MKKFVALFLVIVCLLFVSYDRLFSFFVKKEENILAKVNGEIVTLEEVETLYDMRNVHINSPAPDVERIRQDYAGILYNRIKQILVAQELKRRNVEVTEGEIAVLENVVKESYSDMFSDDYTFADYLEENGINYQMWKKQIRSQIEIDKLQALLLEEITLSSEETMKYAEKIKKEKQNDFENIRFFMLKANAELLKEIVADTAFSKEHVQTNGFSDEEFEKYFEEKGAAVFQALFDSENLPEQYKKVLVAMENNTFSEILTENGDTYVLYLVKKEVPAQEDAVDLYLIAEESLLQEKLPQIFDKWLANAVKTSDIYIVDSFNSNTLKKEKDANKIGRLQEMLTEIEN